MIRKFDKKGVGWLPDDLSSVLFAILLIVAGFIIFNNVNDLVARPADDKVFELHTAYEQQRLLQTYLQTPLTVRGEQNTAHAFLSEFILLDYWLTQNKDKATGIRRDQLEGYFLAHEFTYTLKDYQVLSETLGTQVHYAKDLYYVIRVVDTETGKNVHTYSKPKKLSKQNGVEAQVALPSPQVMDFSPNKYIIIVELREPDTGLQPAFKKLRRRMSLYMFIR